MGSGRIVVTNGEPKLPGSTPVKWIPQFDLILVIAARRFDMSNISQPLRLPFSARWIR